MKIELEKWIIDGSVAYKIINLEKYCEDIINSKTIDLVNNTCEIDEDECFVCIIKENDDNSENYIEDEYEKINYCPYCGEPIKIKIINTIDKTEECNQLSKQREELWCKYNKTDSKKKAEELRQQVRELDNEINNMYNSDSLKKYKIHNEEEY